MKIIREAILIAVVSSLFGLGINAVRNATGLKGLPMDTPWPDNRKMVQLEVPLSYAPGDSLLTVEDAYALFLRGEAIFVDARDPYEYKEGHIKGAINFPFEQWDDYWDSVKDKLDPEKEIVIYCGGLDCELSLFMARELKLTGYEKSYIFFGGWLKWQEQGLPISTSTDD